MKNQIERDLSSLSTEELRNIVESDAKEIDNEEFRDILHEFEARGISTEEKKKNSSLTGTTISIILICLGLVQTMLKLVAGKPVMSFIYFAGTLAVLILAIGQSNNRR